MGSPQTIVVQPPITPQTIIVMHNNQTGCSRSCQTPLKALQQFLSFIEDPNEIEHYRETLSTCFIREAGRFPGMADQLANEAYGFKLLLDAAQLFANQNKEG